MESKIICAFAGLGKTTFAERNPDICIDMESSWWSKIQCSEKGNPVNKWEINNPEFPMNYIQSIKEQIGKYEYILISSSIYVQEELKKNKMFYYLIYPTIDKKEEYIGRYKKRGSTEKFIDCITRNWDERISHHAFTKDCVNIQTNCDYLETVMEWIMSGCFNNKKYAV